ncbi:hypothetical protein KKH03_05520, partial [Patescibacteria group bacterium]|nr:hypothetical protein [Patescibacteria group bacterium]
MPKIMRFVRYQMPQDGGKNKSREQLAMQVAAEAQESVQETSKHKADLDNYLHKFSKEPDKVKEKEKWREWNEWQKEKGAFSGKLNEWYKKGDKEAMRRAGVTQKEDEQDYTRRHRLLASAYVTWDETGDRISGTVDFKNNQMAEYKVGLGDMLPPNVKSVRVRKKSGETVDCARTRNPQTGRIGYYETQALAKGQYLYVAIHTGDKFQIEQTIDEKDLRARRSILSENVAVYNQGAMNSNDGEEVYYTDRGEPVAGTPAAERAQAREKPQAESAKRRASFRETIAKAADELELEGQRRRIVELAKRYSGSDRFKTDYAKSENRDLKGGRLGCAWVVTSILKEAGLMDEISKGTYTAENQLKQKGWTEAPRSQAEPGDVVLWEKLPQKAVMTQNGPQYIGGHRHIGIVVGDNLAVSNSSLEGRPITHAIDSGRRVEKILKPPREQQEPRVAPAEARPANEKLAAAIERKTGRWLPLIKEKCEKYGMSQYIPLVQAIMFQE